jgi:hypothetical protein
MMLNIYPYSSRSYNDAHSPDVYKCDNSIFSSHAYWEVAYSLLIVLMILRLNIRYTTYKVFLIQKEFLLIDVIAAKPKQSRILKGKAFQKLY